MKIYVLSPKSIESAKQKALIRGLISVAFGVILALVGPLGAGFMSVEALAIAGPIILISLVIGFRRGLKMLDENLKSYQLLVSSDFVVKKQGRLPDVEIHLVVRTRAQRGGDGPRALGVDRSASRGRPDYLPTTFCTT